MANMESLSISQIANECCLSESYFRQLFNKQIGISPKEYQTKLKIKKAMSLLLYSNDKILKIALDSGFDSLSNFNRSFKKIVGKSPYLWKKEQLQNI
jgi:AraC-like DNA-binding protein